MSSSLNNGGVTVASGAAAPDPVSSSTTSQLPSEQQRRRTRIHNKKVYAAALRADNHNRSVFRLPGDWRFSFLNTRLLDALLDGVQTCFEGIILLLGPILILVALGIAAILTYAFFHIILPMMLEKHAASSWKYIWIGLHSLVVLFLLTNVLFNYYMCVVTRNTGPHYDRVVRELATATGFSFPETPAEIDAYRREYEDKMTIRIQRRREREAEKLQQQQSATATDDEEVVVPADEGSSNDALLLHRKPKAVPKKKKTLPPTTTNVRRWMLMGPYEWGYCHNSKQPKPPRSHYDHVTKRLILNLDHYCPWMFNVIGYFNYRYFVNFLIFIFCGMAYGVVLAWEPFFWMQSPEFRKFSQQERRSISGHLPRPSPMFPHRDERMLLSLGFMLCAAVGFAILILGGFHVFLVLTAQTTIEFHGNWDKWRQQVMGGIKWRNPYSEGMRKNWKRVYGDQHWFISLLPSTREPEYLPVPIPGRDTKRHHNNIGTTSSSSSIELLLLKTAPPPEDPIAGDTNV